MNTLMARVNYQVLSPHSLMTCNPESERALVRLIGCQEGDRLEIGDSGAKVGLIRCTVC